MRNSAKLGILGLATLAVIGCSRAEVRRDVGYVPTRVQVDVPVRDASTMAKERSVIDRFYTRFGGFFDHNTAVQMGCETVHNPRQYRNIEKWKAAKRNAIDCELTWSTQY